MGLNRCGLAEDLFLLISRAFSQFIFPTQFVSSRKRSFSISVSKAN